MADRPSPRAVQTDGDVVGAVSLKDHRVGRRGRINAHYVLDATELGDLLELAAVEHSDRRRESGPDRELQHWTPARAAGSAGDYLVLRGRLSA